MAEERDDLWQKKVEVLERRLNAQEAENEVRYKEFLTLREGTRGNFGRLFVLVDGDKSLGVVGLMDWREATDERLKDWERSKRDLKIFGIGLGVANVSGIGGLAAYLSKLFG